MPATDDVKAVRTFRSTGRRPREAAFFRKIRLEIPRFQFLEFFFFRFSRFFFDFSSYFFFFFFMIRVTTLGADRSLFGFNNFPAVVSDRSELFDGVLDFATKSTFQWTPALYFAFVGDVFNKFLQLFPSPWSMSAGSSIRPSNQSQ